MEWMRNTVEQYALLLHTVLLFVSCLLNFIPNIAFVLEGSLLPLCCHGNWGAVLVEQIHVNK
jgi:hypothetical protein